LIAHVAEHDTHLTDNLKHLLGNSPMKPAS
jgi:hypothetical protein